MVKTRTHVFVADGLLRRDFHGRRYCRCGLPEVHRLHVEVAAADESEGRRVGEGRGGDDT